MTLFFLVLWAGLASVGLASAGLVSVGLASAGLVSVGLVSVGLAVDGAASAIAGAVRVNANTMLRRNTGFMWLSFRARRRVVQPTCHRRGRGSARRDVVGVAATRRDAPWHAPSGRNAPRRAPSRPAARRDDRDVAARTMQILRAD
ncbi:MAG: hypothetical protein KC464_20920, partial [Myxococcales bacterium]|nr:hypothetical protein [Myxococcales bacterium]